MRYFWPVMAVVCSCLVLNADDDLRINGDFKRMNGDKLAGWELVSGSFQRLPVAGDDDFQVKLTSGSRLYSTPAAVTGTRIKIEAEVSGKGMGRLGYAGYDSSGKLISGKSDGVRFSAGRRKSSVRATLALPAEVKFVSVMLESASGAEIFFEDVEAEFQGRRPAGEALNVNGEAAVPLADGRCYRLNELGALPFSALLNSEDDDIEFVLEEFPDKLWRVLSFDRNHCKVGLKHDRDGIWPFYRYEAEVEIEARVPGKSRVVLENSSGRRVTVIVSSVK